MNLESKFQEACLRVSGGHDDTQVVEQRSSESNNTSNTINGENNGNKPKPKSNKTIFVNALINMRPPKTVIGKEAILGMSTGLDFDFKKILNAETTVGFEINGDGQEAVFDAGAHVKQFGGTFEAKYNLDNGKSTAGMILDYPGSAPGNWQIKILALKIYGNIYSAQNYVRGVFETGTNYFIALSHNYFHPFNSTVENK